LVLLLPAVGWAHMLLTLIQKNTIIQTNFHHEFKLLKSTIGRLCTLLLPGFLENCLDPESSKEQGETTEQKT